MSNAAITVLAMGAFFVLAAAAVLFQEDKTRKALLAFPRNMIAAHVLTLASVCWFAYHLIETDFGAYENLKVLVYIGVPFSFYMLIKYLDELLAVRALGSFILLLGVPILVALRLHDSNWRILVALVVYVFVVIAMYLVLAPYRFRQAAIYLMSNPKPRQALGVSCGVLGLVLVGLGVSVF
jgi:hypothetical protein